MKSLYLFIIALALGMPLFLAACEKEGPAEKAGEKIDQAVEEASEEAREAKEKVEETVK